MMMRIPRKIYRNVGVFGDGDNTWFFMEFLDIPNGGDVDFDAWIEDVQIRIENEMKGRNMKQIQYIV